MNQFQVETFKQRAVVGHVPGLFSAMTDRADAPVPARARSQRVLMDLTENEEIHSNGLDHSLPALLMATADVPGPPFRGVLVLGSTG